MESKKEKLKFNWKMNKEKLIFLFCSGLLLFILSVPNGGKADGKKGIPVNAEAPVSGFGSGESVGENESGTGAAASLGTGASVKSSNTYEEELEDRVREILSHVDGVGEVDVMVVLKSSEEKVVRVDKSVSTSVTEEKDGTGESRIIQQQEQAENTVMNGNGSGSGPVIEKELKPELSGIIISADGGGSAVIKAEISEAMEALFGLPSHKIKVLKRVNKGV